MRLTPQPEVARPRQLVGLWAANSSNVRYSTKHHCLLTSVGLGQVTPAEFLWTPCSYRSRGGPCNAVSLPSHLIRPPADWRRPVGRPRTTWLRTIDDDLQSLNFGVHTAWRKARDRDIWHQVVNTETIHCGVRR